MNIIAEINLSHEHLMAVISTFIKSGFNMIGRIDKYSYYAPLVVLYGLRLAHNSHKNGKLQVEDLKYLLKPDGLNIIAFLNSGHASEFDDYSLFWLTKDVEKIIEMIQQEKSDLFEKWMILTGPFSH